MLILPTEHSLAAAVTAAIRRGDLPELRKLLTDHPDLATARIGGGIDSLDDGGTSRTLLHVATDWPGHYPGVVDTITTLIEAGADVHARFSGPHTETALHWAASSDDVEALDALLDAGADIDADGAVIGGRTAVSDAAAFGQWRTARRLVERGAQTSFWEAATLGLVDRVRPHLTATPAPDAVAITQAFWGACHGGQPAIAELLLDRGADLNWIGWDQYTPLDAARRSNADSLAAWLHDQGAKPAAELIVTNPPS